MRAPLHVQVDEAPRGLTPGLALRTLPRTVVSQEVAQLFWSGLERGFLWTLPGPSRHRLQRPVGVRVGGRVLAGGRAELWSGSAGPGSGPSSRLLPCLPLCHMSMSPLVAVGQHGRLLHWD